MLGPDWTLGRGECEWARYGWLCLHRACLHWEVMWCRLRRNELGLEHSSQSCCYRDFRKLLPCMSTTVKHFLTPEGGRLSPPPTILHLAVVVTTVSCPFRECSGCALGNVLKCPPWDSHKKTAKFSKYRHGHPVASESQMNGRLILVWLYPTSSSEGHA